MIRKTALALAAFAALAACKEEAAKLPQPISMTDEALGHYCQMQLSEHDGPKGQVHLSGLPQPIFFSQVRDVLAYLHMPEQSHAVAAAYVQDMTGASWAEPGAWVLASAVHYVVGSDALGGMGAPELVPFSSRAAAESFAAEHGGAVRGFDEITREDVLGGGAALPEPNDAEDIGARLRALGQ